MIDPRCKAGNVHYDCSCDDLHDAVVILQTKLNAMENDLRALTEAGQLIVDWYMNDCDPEDTIPILILAEILDRLSGENK